MKDLTTISSDLFNKIRSRFSEIKIGDEKGVLINDPADARFFDVNFSVGGTDLGRVNIKIDEKSLTVIYNNSMTEGQAESVKKKWFAFLKDMRQFARKSMLTFDTRDISKSNLEKRDYEYLAKKSGDAKMSESKLFGTSKTSYQDMGEATIIVKHTQPVNYNVPAGRTQHIDSIYIESATGERFRYPHKHLNGARAMARHVANGGTAYDIVGQYISGLSEELGKLRQFKNYTHRSGVMAEALGDITERVLERIEGIKSEISNLQKQNYYEQFKETFEPGEQQTVPEDIMNDWVDALTIKTFNEELKSVFPYIYKLVSEKRAGEVRYDDLVSEEDDAEEDEDEVQEHSIFDEFVDQIESVAKLDYENAVEEQPQEAPQQGISQEVVEFIKSMYDSQTGTFPRGEEGVKIAVEKKFGEQAGRFANFVVEKLSAKNQPAMQEMGAELANNDVSTAEHTPQQTVQSSNVELLRIKELSGLGNETAVQEDGISKFWITNPNYNPEDEDSDSEIEVEVDWDTEGRYQSRSYHAPASYPDVIINKVINTATGEDITKMVLGTEIEDELIDQIGEKEHETGWGAESGPYVDPWDESIDPAMVKRLAGV